MSLHILRAPSSRASAPKEYYFPISPTSRPLRKHSHSQSGRHRSSSFNSGVRQIFKAYSPFHKRQRDKTKENAVNFVVRNIFSICQYSNMWKPCCFNMNNLSSEFKIQLLCMKRNAKLGHQIYLLSENINCRFL